MDKILFWFDFFKDKRFSLRFKLANLIMNDYLRNYLAVGCMVPLDNTLRYVEAKTNNEKYMQRQMGKVANTIEDIFKM